MSVDQQRIRVGFIGGGPRSVGIIERFTANAFLLSPGITLELLVIDPYPAGPGRIWRYGQSPNLKMNSLAEDVAVFTDASCQLEGPVVPGPTLAEWFDLVRSGEIPFEPPDPLVAAELREIGPQGFATRHLFSCYMRWYFEHVRDSAPASIQIEEIRGEVLNVRSVEEKQLLDYRDEAGHLLTQDVDFVVYAVGHTDSEPSSFEVEVSRRASELGLYYWPSHYAYDIDLDAIPATEAVLLRGLGLSFIDIVVRLTLDRGGREVVDPAAPPGQRTTYIPSGDEPHIIAGSRRGVPYHSKITSHFHGERPGLTTTFLTRDVLVNMLDTRDEVDFNRDVWPLIVREMAYWHYREIFTGHPERVRGSWEEFSQIFHEEDLGSERLTAAIHAAVSPDDVFSIDYLDRPLDDVSAPSLAAFQDLLADYIQRDLHLREAEEHSETLAIFWATLASYLIIGETLGHPNWSMESRVHALPKRWHDFFSYLDSGPPASRLELVLALQRAGLLTFAGGDLQVEIASDATGPAFVATSRHQPEALPARYLIESFHPERTVVRSTNPVLRDLVTTAEGFELVLDGTSGPVSTRKLAIDFENGNVLRPDGSQHERRFAIGDFTSGVPAGAFSRPNTNARIFRENDRLARNLLHAFVSVTPRAAEPTLTR